MLLDMVSQMEACATASDAAAAALGFADALRPYGLSGLGARVYRLPTGPINPRVVDDAGGAIVNVWPDNWHACPGHLYICFDENPLTDAMRARRTAFRFTDLAPREKHGTYWEAFSEGRISEGVGIYNYRPGGRVASLSLLFERMELAPAEEAMLRAAGRVLVERMSVLESQHEPAPKLTPREYDCLAYVAAGKSDWEISVILSLSQTTVRFHVDNARAKLDAATRAHAVARALALGLI